MGTAGSSTRNLALEGKVLWWDNRTGRRPQKPNLMSVPYKGQSTNCKMQRTILGRQGGIPDEDRRPTKHDRTSMQRQPSTLKNYCRIRVQPSKVEARWGRQKEGEPEARTAQLQARKGVEKSYAEIVHHRQLASRDQSYGETRANFTNHD